MDLTIRPITEDEIPTFRTVLIEAFGGDRTEDGDVRFKEQMDLSRTYPVFDGDDMIATSGAFTFDVSVPGTTTAMGGLTMVSVRPTHRRRGILRSMIDAHFADVRDRGELLSGLWASETPIYGRFGYGDAVARHDLTVHVPRASLRPSGTDDTVRIVDADAALKVLPTVYDARRQDRPGMLSRSEPWWRVRRFYDGTEIRDGSSARRYAIATRNGEPVGYVTYRQKEKWDDWLPDGSISVIELIGDRSAQLALWDFLASIDLFPNISWWNAPVDDPVPWLARNVRAVTVKLAESLWVRLMDVDRCLELRSYRNPGRLVLGVTDATIAENAGAHLLEVDESGEASCETIGAEADVTLDVSTLGALYMGGRSAVQLAAAGLIAGSDEKVRLLDALMTWDPPWCPEVF